MQRSPPLSREAILQALQARGGNITQAVKRLGLSRTVSSRCAGWACNAPTPPESGNFTAKATKTAKIRRSHSFSTLASNQHRRGGRR